MNFSKDNNTKTVGPFIPFHCVEILLYKKCTKPIYKLVNTKKESITNSICRWNVTTVQMGYSELPIHDVFKICLRSQLTPMCNGFNTEFYMDFYQ